MRLPHRVPWASTSELEQVCSWIYTDENDLDATLLAINRLSAWKAITSLPHALESVLSLLSALYQDRSQTASTFHLSLRQSYSAAIIRLVNGLVDPLQLGAYARSIASIASQLGLPLRLVELRHAATHEDLPSLELLREAARESMAWLLQNYFLPTIYPHTSQSSQPALRSLQPILKQYKSLTKTIIRDVSLKAQYKQEIFQVMKELERWIAEARVAANMALRQASWEANGETPSLDLGDVDPQESWALERFCDALLDKGALVPLSKKKRDFPQDKFFPPLFSIRLWETLLQHLQGLHPEFLRILSGRLISVLSDDTPGKERQLDISYDICAARWVMWCIEASETDELQCDVGLRRDVISTLMQSLGHTPRRPRGIKAAIALLELLCADAPQLDALLMALKRMHNEVSTNKWSMDDVAIMDQRLQTLLSSDLDSDSPQSLSRPQTELPSMVVSKFPLGWRLFDEKSGWRPCPIGVHCETK